MIFLLANWRWLLPTAALLGALGYGGIEHLKLVNLQAAVAQERYDAAKLMAEKEIEARQKDDQNAQLARDLDAARAKAAADAEASRAAFDDKLAGVLRTRRSTCPNGMPAASGNPGQPQSAAAGSDPGPRALAAGSGLRAMILSLQADVKECVTWAGKVGR